MDESHFRWSGYLVLALLCVGCSKPSKSAETVFPQETRIDCASNQIRGSYTVEWESGELTNETGAGREQFLDDFVKPNLEKIARVEHDFEIRHITPEYTEVIPNPSPTLPILNWNVKETQTSDLWDLGLKGSGIAVAVIDSGVDIRHPQIAPQLFTNVAELNGVEGVDDDKNGHIDDVHGWNFADKSATQTDEVGHGTHVAGTIAANSNFGPIQGAAPEAKILPLDFMSGGTGTSSAAILSIEYAAKMGAKIINASWGSSHCSKILEDTIKKLNSKDILFVTAAGNSRSDLSESPEYPAVIRSENSITVGASTREFLRAGFSNWGSLVHVVAPGKDILSTYPGGVYAVLDGTSMAAPLVAGQAALIWGKFPTATAEQVKQALITSVRVGTFAVESRGETRGLGAYEALGRALLLLQ